MSDLTAHGLGHNRKLTLLYNIGFYMSSNYTTTITPSFAIYARFSCDKQSETSLEDQTRRCRQLAARHGFNPDEGRIYSDAAVSGTAKGDAHRDGYREMLEDWMSGKFQVLFADELSRLSRDPEEIGRLLNKLRKNRRLRLITAADNLDTQSSEWQFRFGLQGLMASHESMKLGERVDRGMVGQLERGYMIATPPYGYDLQRQFADNGKFLGTAWVVNESEAATVREVFARRAAGDSMHQIAAWLNAEAVPCSRRARNADGGHWRASRIKGMLSNNIYRGIFIWHGSTTYQKRARDENVEIKTVQYPREHLRLVSEETWQRCHRGTISRSGYGGGTHALTGVLSCGCCHSTLALTAPNKRSRSVYCAICTERASAKPDERANLLTSTVATAGVQQLLTHAIQHFLSAPFLDAHRGALRRLLDNNEQQQTLHVQAELNRLLSTQSRLLRMMRGDPQEDDLLQQRYDDLQPEVAQLRQRLAQLYSGHALINEKSVLAQLEVSPHALVGSLFDEQQPPQRLRTVLAQLFPHVVFQRKSSKYTSHFMVRFSIGAALAMASGTEEVTVPGQLQGQFVLQYKPQHHSGGQPVTGPHWTVLTIDTRHWLESAAPDTEATPSADPLLLSTT